MIEHDPTLDENVEKAIAFILDHLDNPPVQCIFNDVGKDGAFCATLFFCQNDARDKWKYELFVSPTDFEMGLPVTLKSGSWEKVVSFLRSDRALEKTLDRLYLTIRDAEKTFAPGSDFYDPYLHF